MREVTTAPTPADTIIRALVHARMDDGAPISTQVKVDTILDQLGMADVPHELRVLIATGIKQRVRRANTRPRVEPRA